MVLDSLPVQMDGAGAHDGSSGELSIIHTLVYCLGQTGNT